METFNIFQLDLLNFAYYLKELGFYLPVETDILSLKGELQIFTSPVSCLIQMSSVCLF